MKKYLSLLMSCILLFATAILHTNLLSTAQDDDSTPPRTYYETLDLDTPESAVMTFVDAFQRRDFPTVYLIFSAYTQLRMQQNLNLLRYDAFVRREQEREISATLPLMGEGEHSLGNLDYVFDLFMLEGLEQSALLIDLSGKVEIMETQQSTPSDSTDQTYTDVITTVENIEGEVIFRMSQAPSGRWRVRQVITEGGDEESIPWSVPPHTSNVATTLWETPCDDTPPEQSLVDTGEPAIIVDPPCGILGQTPDASTPVTISGINFLPELPVRFFFYLDERSVGIDIEQVAIPDENGAFSVEVIPYVRIRGTVEYEVEVLAGQNIPHYP